MLITNELSRTYPGLNSGAVGTVVRLPHQQTGGSNKQKLLQSGFPGGDRSMAPMVQFWLRAGAITVAVPALTRELADGSGTSRTALPLELAFALTVHRAAGLTLPSIIIHCDTLWRIGGLCYTALSRVASVEHVQLVGSMQNIFSRDDCVDFMQQAAASSAAPFSAAAAAAEAEAEAEAEAVTKQQCGPSSSDGSSSDGSGVAAARKRPQSATEGSDPASSGLAATKRVASVEHVQLVGSMQNIFSRDDCVDFMQQAAASSAAPFSAAAAAAEAEAEAEAEAVTKQQCGPSSSDGSSSDGSGVAAARKRPQSATEGSDPASSGLAATKRQCGPSSSDGSGVVAARKRPQSGLAATKLQCGASSSGGRGTECVVLVYPNQNEKDAVTLTEVELDRLDNNEFLNDSLIDYQIKVIQQVCVPLVLRMCGPAYTCCALTLLCPPCAHCTASVTRQARPVPLLQLLHVHKTP